MTFDEWWKECSGWYREEYDTSGLSEWCLARDVWDYQQKRIAELREAIQDVVANRGTNIPLEASIDALAALGVKDE